MMMDDYLCQICLQVRTDHSEWRTDITGTPSAGNVCTACMTIHGRTFKVGDALRAAVRVRGTRDPQHMSLREHCHHESGGLEGAALDRYISRYYGHS
jgi:hypothetical protein